MPKRFSTAELKEVGVEILDRYNVCLKCMNCGSTWCPNLQAAGRLAKRSFR